MIMKQWIKWSVPVAMALTVGSVSAIPITGSITFDGGVQLNTSSAATATEVTAWTGPASTGFQPYVLTDSLSFATIAGNTPVSIVSPWSFNTPSSSPIMNFWSVGGFSFELLSSSIFAQGVQNGVGTVSVTGTGIITGNGYTATAATWSFSSSDPSAGTPAVFSIQAASGTISGVPDGGTTIMLLGAALSGLGLLKRKLSA